MYQNRSATAVVGRRCEAYYRGLLAEQEASGRSVRAFAAERGLSPWTLYGWRGKLGQSRRRSVAENGANKEPGFVSVDVVGGTPSSSDFEVELADGLIVRVPRDTTTVRLVELVRALRSC
jgi:transposase-like protein